MGTVENAPKEPHETPLEESETTQIIRESFNFLKSLGIDVPYTVVESDDGTEIADISEDTIEPTRP